MYGRMHALTPMSNPLRPPARYKYAWCIVHSHVYLAVVVECTEWHINETEGRATVTRKYGLASFSLPFSLSFASAILFPRSHEFPFFFVHDKFQWLRMHRYRLIHEMQPLMACCYAPLSLSKLLKLKNIYMLWEYKYLIASNFVYFYFYLYITSRCLDFPLFAKKKIRWGQKIVNFYINFKFFKNKIPRLFSLDSFKN